MGGWIRLKKDHSQSGNLGVLTRVRKARRSLGVSFSIGVKG